MRFKKQPKRPAPKTTVRKCDNCGCLQKHTMVAVDVSSDAYPGHTVSVPTWMCNVCGHKEWWEQRMTSAAYRAGRRAKRLGYRRIDNPYASGTKARTDWRSGWQSLPSPKNLQSTAQNSA